MAACIAVLSRGRLSNAEPESEELKGIEGPGRNADTPELEWFEASDADERR
jgi:hypothetical protein